jgi:hypothetical protein
MDKLLQEGGATQLATSDSSNDSFGGKSVQANIKNL